MTSFLIMFLCLALLLGAFAYLAMPTASRMRLAVIVGMFAAILGNLFFGCSDMLGRPKPTRLQVVRTNMQNVKVVGAYVKEGDKIYLWLQLAGVNEPRYYKLPWDDKAAKRCRPRPPTTSASMEAALVWDCPPSADGIGKIRSSMRCRRRSFLTGPERGRR
jgi:hypothetical protein